MESRNRYRPGEIRDAIVGVLQDNGSTLSVADIQSGVASRLGSKIPSSSVRSYLRLNEGTVFTRRARGQYSLVWRDDEQPLAAPEPAYVFGGSTLFAGDCIGWLRARERNSIHGVVTDPPYGLVEYESTQIQKLRQGRGGVWRIPPSFDGHERSPLPRFTTLTPDDKKVLSAFFTDWGRALLPVLVPGAHVFVATNPLLSFIVSNSLAMAGFERRGEIARLVMTMRGGDRPKNAHNEFSDVTVMPRSMWEPWLLFRKPIEGRVQDNLRMWGTGGLRRQSAERPFGDVIASYPTRAAERRLAPHPSLKPQQFLRQVVRAVLPLGQGIVLDPFAGSGSTLAAANAVGYESIGVELDGEYVAMAKDAIPRLAALDA